MDKKYHPIIAMSSAESCELAEYEGWAKSQIAFKKKGKKLIAEQFQKVRDALNKMEHDLKKTISNFGLDD